jgi:myo-inositol-1(or 4)-monophosphatase
MALVAAGTFDAMIAMSAKRDWDTAAADLIVREAGGIVTTHDGHIPRYNGDQAIQPSIICAGPALHRQILARVSHIQLPR